MSDAGDGSVELVLTPGTATTADFVMPDCIPQGCKEEYQLSLFVEHVEGGAVSLSWDTIHWELFRGCAADKRVISVAVSRAFHSVPSPTRSRASMPGAETVVTSRAGAVFCCGLSQFACAYDGMCQVARPFLWAPTNQQEFRRFEAVCVAVKDWEARPYVGVEQERETD